VAGAFGRKQAGRAEFFSSAGVVRMALVYK